ncbi:MAG: type I 3-dehydroquinate dehydratase, partial [Halobacteriota archaeon]|nr:type I 3-dehydroquinate dehydratase [Halobacteriota archaeon]
MTKLVTSVMTNGPESALAYANQAIAEGADLIEFRLDGWDDPNDGFEKLCPHLPGGRWILTCRTAWEGGAWRGAEEDRLALMLRALRENAGYVDFEYAEWRGSPAVRRRFAEALGNGAHTPRLILSAHDFNANGRGIIARLPEMLREASAYAVKLAWSARDITDNFTALDLLRRANRPAAIICMG